MSGLLLSPSAATATEFLLETNNPYPNEDGQCGLIEALDNANDDAQTHPDCPAGNGADEITLGSTIALDGSELFPASNPVFFDTGDSGLPEIESELTIRRGTITRIGNLDFRYFVVQPTGLLKLEDVFIINGRAVGDCRGFSGDSFTGCGGAIVVNQGTLVLNRSYLFQNSASESTESDSPRGGSVMLFNAVLNASETRFFSNSAELGGAIGAQFATADIRDSLFEGNSAVTSGGAVHSNLPSEIFVSGSVFSNNQVTAAAQIYNGGGAIDNAGSSSQLTVINSQFIANSALSGGAINNFNASDASVINSTFTENSATYGGAIRNAGSSAVLNLISSTVIGNQAFIGAGLANGSGSSDTTNILDSHIVGNDATTDGGGVASSGNLNISNSLVDNNSGNEGGGISVGSASNQVVTINFSTVSNNFAQSIGGGLHFEENPTEFPNRLNIINSTFDHNQADEGGGLFAEVVDVSIAGSTFSGNTASQVGVGSGGGIHVRSFVVTGAQVDIVNSTISGNIASQDGGGIYLTGSALDAVITSTTIANNTANSASGGDGLHSLTSPARVNVKDLILASNGNRNCLKTATLGYTDGGNNISSDDSCEFADAGNGTGDNVDPLINELGQNGGPSSTHSLQTLSPAIDEGSADCPATDQRGAGRTPACDIGAYEAGISLPVLSLNIDKMTLFEADETVSTLSVTLDNAHVNSQRVNVTVPIRLTGNATGMGLDYTLSNQNGHDAELPGRVIPFSFTLSAGERSTLSATITAVDDLLFEGEESITIEAGANGFAEFSGSNSITLIIVSDDPNPLPDTSFNDGFESHSPYPE